MYVHCVTSNISQDMETCYCPMKDKEDYIYRMEYYEAVRKGEILQFATMQMK